MENLVFSGQKIGGLMGISMSENSAKAWFGAVPPDLTLATRARSAKWIYTYLRTFYVDDSKTFGGNDLTFPNVGMPHVLQELQGTPRISYEDALIDGETVKRYVGIQSDGDGELSPDEYNKAILDLVNYLQYTGEPSRLGSEKIGKGVLVFIFIFFIFAYLLKKDYWRGVKK